MYRLNELIDQISDAVDDIRYYCGWVDSYLPDDDREVLVANKSKQVFIASYDWQNRCWTSNDRSKMLDITHWMELPDAPEEK